MSPTCDWQGLQVTHAKLIPGLWIKTYPHANKQLANTLATGEKLVVSEIKIGIDRSSAGVL